MKITKKDRLVTISVSPKFKETLTKYQGKLMREGGKKVTYEKAICHALRIAIQKEFPEDNFEIKCAERESPNAK